MSKEIRTPEAAAAAAATTDSAESASGDGSSSSGEEEEALFEDEETAAAVVGNGGKGRRPRNDIMATATTARPSKKQKASVRRSGAAPADNEPGDGEDATTTTTATILQQSLLPSVSDPSLWMVSCKNGKEQELALQLMNKCVAWARQGTPLGISGVVAAHSKGTIYVEARSEAMVLQALQGVRGCLKQHSNKIRRVPIQDMTTIMTVTPRKKPIQKKDWVRITRGMYKGDLGLVMAVDSSGLKCVVQCVPRLDYGETTPRSKVRPPKQSFQHRKATMKLGRRSLPRQNFPGLDIVCDYFENNHYFNGYLVKEMNVGSMVKACTDVDAPSPDELQHFPCKKVVRHNNRSNSDGKDYIESPESSHGFMLGDTVEVIDGDLVGMRGKIVGLHEATIRFLPQDSTTNLESADIELLPNQLRKCIDIGSHIKVTAGRYVNETGQVVAIEDEGDSTMVVVLTDNTNEEITVGISQLHESTEVGSGRDKLFGYELFDLVSLSSANDVAIVVRVGHSDFTILDNHNVARIVRPEEVRCKQNHWSDRAVALDALGNHIRVRDTVTVIDGQYKGLAATVKRMNKTQFFLHSHTRVDNAGIIVVRSRSCMSGGACR